MHPFLAAEQRKKIYNEIAKDYAKRHNAPYVHVFENGNLVDTICTKGVINDKIKRWLRKVFKNGQNSFG